MKTTLLLLSFISILTCVEAGFSEGFIMGIIMNDLSESKKHHTDRDSSIIKLKNNMMTIDTSLCEFPPQKNPICVEINQTRRLTILEDVYLSMLSVLITSIPILLFTNGDDNFREFILGYMVGKGYSSYRNRRY
tara:strand:+ start:329 stop:730 length:402 start_codon:yes stop_codon:yes gene_type:complete